MSSGSAAQSVSSPGIKVPHVFVILFSVIVLSVIATHFITSGEFERVKNEQGRTVVVDGTYKEVASSPAGFMDIFRSIQKGSIEAGNIIFYIFFVGGAFGIFRATGAVEGAVGSISQKIKGRENLVIPVFMTLFALGGAMMGLAEETIPYISIIVPLCLMLGFDSMVGAAIVLLGTGAGFTAAYMNPFTVGVAQGIAELPLFSGLGLRFAFWVIFLSISITYVMIYAKKVQKDPTKSVMGNMPDSETCKPGAGMTKMSPEHKRVLIVLVISLVTLAFGVIKFGWYINEIAGLFLLMGVAMGAVAKMSPNRIADSFIEGCRVLVLGALVVGFARAILVVLQDAKAMDTILYGLSSLIQTLPSSLAALGMYISQCLLNFIVPSGSGQAALTMPIMTPLSDLLGVTRQTAVLAFQFGDGISNIFSPTSGYFMAGLALAGISWDKWAKWILPLILIHYSLGAVFITFAHFIGW